MRSGQRIRNIRVLGAVVILLLSTVCAADSGIDERTALQNTIESGEDLSPRARKVLFSCRSRQDEGRYDAAVQSMAEWIEAHPDRPHHLLSYNLALSYLNLDQAPKALQNLELAVTQEPRFARGWLKLGEVAYEQLDYAKAAEAFDHGYSLMVDPRPEIRYYSAVAWLLASQPAKALDGISELLRDHREGAPLDWYQAMIAAAIEAEQYEPSKPLLENCLLDNEDNPKAWLLAYQLAAARQDYEQAAVWLTVVGYLRPLMRDELLQLGDLYAGSGTPLQAARYYRQAYDSSEVKTTADEYVRLASAWMAAYQYEEARAVLDQGVAAGPTVGLLALLGDLHYAQDDFGPAREAFSRCVNLDPDYGRGWLMSGYCCLELGDNSQAQVCLQKASKFSGQERVARELLKRIKGS